MKDFYIIGLMSGTSIDGLDLVYVKFSFENTWNFKIICSKTYEYDDEWQDILKKLITKDIKSINLIDEKYTKLISDYILQFIDQFNISRIDFVSSHGHTALHDPSKHFTYQIGNMPELSNYIDLKVICDFRAQDVKYGGQGAPLVPVGEKYLFSEYKTLLNLGGFANITKRSKNNIIAYDICPVNIVFNHLCKSIKQKFDDKGKAAALGKINMDLLTHLQSLDYYKLEPPKSLGLEWVNNYIDPILDKFSRLSTIDLLHTFSNHFAIQITKNIEDNQKVLTTGGGAYNDFLIQNIRNLSTCSIDIPNQTIIDYKEALIFAFLGVLRDLNINNCYSSVTGALKSHSSGKIIMPKY
tara:strand:+ start:277 stop:1338 length:1062 start_codon:yes stop_codon:yes gene_type:complete